MARYVDVAPAIVYPVGALSAQRGFSTSKQGSDEYWRGKEIHYRMHPENVSSLTAAQIDCCTLANNLVLDWGYAGLAETIDTLSRAGVKTAGAGRNRTEAESDPSTFSTASPDRVRHSTHTMSLHPWLILAALDHPAGAEPAILRGDPLHSVFGRTIT